MSLLSSTDPFEPCEKATVVSPATGIDCAQRDGFEDFIQAGQAPDVHMVVSPLIVCDGVTTSSNDDDCVEDGSDPRENPALTTSNISFRVGDRFASFVELEKAVVAYSSCNSVQLWKRDARTIDAARKRVGNIASKMGEHLKYQSLKYCCIHGGKKFTSTATGRSSSTFKHDCGFHIYIVATKDGANLEVRSVCLQHTNHTVSKPLSKHTPQRRKVGPGFKHRPLAHNIPSTKVPLSKKNKKPEPLPIDKEKSELLLSSHQKHHRKPEHYDGASGGLTRSETLPNDNVKAQAPASVRLAPVPTDSAKGEPIPSSHQKYHQEIEPLPIDNVEDEPILSSRQKHEKAAAVAGKIARMISEVSMPKFRRRLQVLEALLRDWSSDQDVSIVVKEQVAAGGREKGNQCIASPCFKPANVSEVPGKSNADTFTLPADEAAARLSCITTVVPVVSGQNIIPPTVLPIKTSEPLTCFNANEANTPSSDAVKEIEIAPCMSNCRHPTESNLTMVPSKRKRFADCGPFRSRTSEEKKSTVLTWLVGEAATADALNGRVLEKEDVETKPELLHCGVLDDSVDVNIVRTFFTSDAWIAVTSVVNAKRSVHQWVCEECCGDLKEFDSILCDWCLGWYHIPCTPLKRQPKKKLWQCSYCM